MNYFQGVFFPQTIRKKFKTRTSGFYCKIKHSRVGALGVTCLQSQGFQAVGTNNSLPQRLSAGSEKHPGKKLLPSFYTTQLKKQ